MFFLQVYGLYFLVNEFIKIYKKIKKGGTIMNMKRLNGLDKLRTQNLQGMIVSNPVNVKYLTGY